MTEPLILPAKVIDGFSTPLKNLVSRLKDVKAPDGMKQVGKQLESLRKEADALGKAVTNGFGGLTSGLGLGAIGAGAFTAAGALAAVGTAVRSFADNAVRMRKFSHETGIAVTTLQKMQQVSDGLAIDPDSIASGLSFAARNADDMRLRQGNYGAIAGLRGGKSIAEDLANTKSNDEVVQKELNYLAMQKNAQQRRALSGLFFGTEEFAEFGANGIESLKKRMDSAGKNTYVPSEEDTKKAEAFQDAISHLSATFENLKNSVGGELAPQIIAAADAFKDFSDAHVGDVKIFFHDVVDIVKQIDWAGTAKNFHDLFDDIKSIADWASGFKNPFGDTGESSNGIVKGSPADKLLQWWNSGYESGSGQPGSGKSGSDQDVPFWAPLPGSKKSSVDGSGDAVQPNRGMDRKSDQPIQSIAPKVVRPDQGVDLKPDQPIQRAEPKPDQTTRDPSLVRERNGLYHPAAYHPGMQAALIGASAARNNETIATLAKGVELGMIAFTQSYLGNSASTGKGGTNGVQNVSWGGGGSYGGGGKAVFGGGGKGGSLDVSGAGIGPIPTGSKAQRAKDIVDSLKAAGMPHENAVVWAGATMGAESGYGSAQRGDFIGGRATAFGSVQWHMPRVKDIFKGTGIDVRSAGMADQTKAMIWEMKKMGIWDRVVKAKNPQEVLRVAIKEYERPLDQGPRQFNNRAAIANALRKALESQREPERKSASKAAVKAGLQGAAAPSSPPQNGKVDIHVHSKDHPVTVKRSDSDLFQDLKIDRGKSVSM
ncbi:hypothetical protein FBZ99_101290 [Rhizobium sp. ERR 1071]|uniref:phage tail tip lysozyme n=1 Tax=Rhizobium sp. ERR 1071 TaxID=2572677 RepID=UPI001199A02E|nr:phage tail tip lysozyme [Rhizobium sp. ERR1071]TWB19517.1 hypothetical protein FBZ99_101290 [Rhizobium sp. ERR1071]